MDLVFSDTFTSLDTTTWTPRTFYESAEVGLPGRVPNLYSAGNVTVDGAGLHIRAERDGGQYKSGWLDTIGKRSWRYGYYEARMRYPDVPGIWSGFFAVDVEGYPPEIDAGEVFGNDGRLQWCIRQAVGLDHPVQHSPVSLLGGWHTYGFRWELDYVAFYLDGREMWRCNAYSPDMEMHLYLSLGMGEWQEPNDALLPASVDVAFVKVWQRGGA